MCRGVDKKKSGGGGNITCGGKEGTTKGTQLGKKKINITPLGEEGLFLFGAASQTDVH